MPVADFHLGAGDLEIEGSPIGYTTEEGVVVRVEPDVFLAKSGKFGSTPLKMFLIGQKIEVDVAMAELTLANMDAAFPGADLSGNALQFGGVAGREIVGKELTLVPFDGTPSWTFKNAVPTSAVELAYKPGEQRVIKVTFTAMVDDTVTPEEANIAEVS